MKETEYNGENWIQTRNVNMVMIIRVLEKARNFLPS
jgi:hypothetical protein